MNTRDGTKPSWDGGPLSATARDALAGELEDALHSILKAWFPRCVDQEHGGFLSSFDYRWRPRGPQLKTLEYETRMLRLLSRVSAHPRFGRYREFATHGFHYLRNVMWDREYGGWFRMLDPSGTPLEGATKHGHGASYGIAACVAYYELTSDPQALDLAKQAFQWMERFGHDPEYGGYFALYQRDGTHINSRERCPIPNLVRDCIGTPLGLKDANTNGDMLETIVDLCQVSSDRLVKERLLEMLHVVRDIMIVPPGAVHMYFQPDWTPVPDISRYSYGLNTSNILAKAARSPCLESDLKTLEVIKSVVDSVLEFGWDHSHGGFFYGGSTFGPTYVEDITVFIDAKFWWPQAEGMRALLRAALHYPDDERNYLQRFNELWTYIRTYLIDAKRGGWLWVGRDSRPRRWRSPKATPWKEPSHEVHSLLECIRMLRS
ncbi:MAG: AGE family epimerase/isomerase [Acidobacteriia bacterium]|nr:AGE family epimerase/isomerase [Terriglobia bacterium]